VVGIDAAGGDVSDPDGHAWEAYGAVDGELVLIRPDGHIGIRSTDEAVVTDYLAAVLQSRDLSGGQAVRRTCCCGVIGRLSGRCPLHGEAASLGPSMRAQLSPGRLARAATA
jgi:hypothetical protein